MIKWKLINSGETTLSVLSAGKEITICYEKRKRNYTAT